MFEMEVMENIKMRYFSRFLSLLGCLFCVVILPYCGCNKGSYAIFTLDDVYYDVASKRLFTKYTFTSSNASIKLAEQISHKGMTYLVSKNKEQWGGSSNYVGPYHCSEEEFEKIQSNLSSWILVDVGKKYFIKVNQQFPVWKRELADGRIVTIYVFVCPCPEVLGSVPNPETGIKN